MRTTAPWRSTTAAGLATVAFALAVPLLRGDAAPPDATPPAAGGDAAVAPADNPTPDLPATVDEARGRARMLHEVVHGALQVVHRDFFDEDASHTLPSQSLEDVFAVMADQWGVEIRWLAVNASAMNADHQPQDDFEKQAVQALADGNAEFEAVDGERYRHAGTVRLASQCLKCHLPRRTSTEDRAAGLVISLPLQPTR